MEVKFKFGKKIRDFDAIGVKIRPFPLTLHVGLTTVQRYRAACDPANVKDQGIFKREFYHCDVGIFVRISRPTT